MLFQQRPAGAGRIGRTTKEDYKWSAKNVREPRMFATEMTDEFSALTDVFGMIKPWNGMISYSERSRHEPAPRVSAETTNTVQLYRAGGTPAAERPAITSQLGASHENIMKVSRMPVNTNLSRNHSGERLVCPSVTGQTVRFRYTDLLRLRPVAGDP